MPYNLITILGPTATGKTNLAARLAAELNGEIISADSRQVYKRMDIGTGKDLVELKMRNINYHLIDICEPSEEYNLFRFRQDFKKAFNQISEKKKLPILVGGTGLYISSVLQNYELPPLIFEKSNYQNLNTLEIDELRKLLLSVKPDVHNKTDLTNKERMIKAIMIEQSRIKYKAGKLNLSSLNIGINPGRDEIKKNITERLKSRLGSGMIEEVKDLLDSGITAERLKAFGLEYKFVYQYITGELNYNDMFQKLDSAIHNFAKRQITWFRKMENENIKINWFTGSDYNEILSFILKELQNDETVS
ncbi:tRNA (adenosine(37)-N6)-dimethylallyltransferase MiaA [Candidatus Parcubacteria bacterium]|nr:MAG: tRNA (adenosine(37)-N6)-dimethylallyltransferase MiaA [Candidatus Parcubacteria bacterium]